MQWQFILSFTHASSDSGDSIYRWRNLFCVRNFFWKKFGIKILKNMSESAWIMEVALATNLQFLSKKNCMELPIKWIWSLFWLKFAVNADFSFTDPKIKTKIGRLLVNGHWASTWDRPVLKLIFYKNNLKTCANPKICIFAWNLKLNHERFWVNNGL